MGKVLQKYKVILLTISLLFLMYTPINATPGDMTFVSEALSTTYPLLYRPRTTYPDGNYLYVAAIDSDTISIFDISNPSQPHLISQLTDSINLNNSGWIDKKGNYLYISSWDSLKLAVVDISNKLLPVIVETFTPTNAYVGYVDFYNNYLILGGDDYDTCFTIIDNSNPANLIQVSNADHPNYCNGVYDVAVYDHYAYAFSTSGTWEYLTIFDISNPSTPVFLNSWSDAGSGYPDMNCVDMEIKNNTLFCGGAAGTKGFFSFDISNPPDITLNDALVDGSIYNIGYYALISNYAFCTNRNNSSELFIIDISNPLNMEHIYTYKNNGLIGSYNSTIQEDYYISPRSSITNGYGFHIFKIHTGVISNLNSLNAYQYPNYDIDVTSEYQFDNQIVGVFSDLNLIADISTNFNDTRDWSLLQAGTDGNKTYIYYPNDMLSIPGFNGDSFTLYTLYSPAHDGVFVCPNVTSFEQITPQCNGGTYIPSTNSDLSILSTQWAISNMTQNSGAFGVDLDSIPNSIAKITSIGSITNIPDWEYLFYYFTSSNPLIKGETEPNTIVNFVYKGITASTTSDLDGVFQIRLNSPVLNLGDNEITYYPNDKYGRDPLERILTLRVGCSTFPTNIYQAYCMTEQSDTNSSLPGEDSNNQPINNNARIEDPSDTLENILTRVLIRLVDKKGNPFINTKVAINDIQYYTNDSGYLTLTNIPFGNYQMQIEIDGKVLGVDISIPSDTETLEVIIENDEEENRLYMVIIGLGFLISFILLAYVINRIRKRYI